MPDSNLSFALRYAQAGYKIFPIYEVINGKCACGNPDCRSKGKHPRLPQWDGRASSDPKVIKIWWEQWPTANLGMPLPGLVVLDIDPRNGGDANLDILLGRHGSLPRTMQQKTGGGGSHYLFTMNGGTYGKAIDAGVDLKFGEHQYICVEPSIHESGQRYVWLDEESPFEGGIIAEAPHWFEQAPSKPASPLVAGVNPAAGRNNALSAEAFHLRKVGLSPNEIESVISLLNDKFPNPLEPAEVHTIAHGKKIVEPNSQLQTEGKFRTSLLIGSGVSMSDIEWLWQDWLMAGKFHIIAGSPGAGKTTLLLAMMATASVGGRWPDGSHCKQGHVIYWSGEDDLADTILPRFSAMGGNLERFHWVECQFDEDNERRQFDPSRDVESLTEALAQLPDVRIVGIDPLSRGIRGDSNKSNEVSRSLAPLHELAEKCKCATVGIMHLTKSTQGKDPTERINGSIAFAGQARGNMLAVIYNEPPPGVGCRVLVKGKYNCANSSGGYRYDLEQMPVPGYSFTAQGVLWGDVVDGNAKTIMDRAEEDAEQRERRSGVQECEDLLKEILGDGPMFKKHVFERTKAAGYTDIMVQRAFRSIGGISSGPNAMKMWSL